MAEGQTAQPLLSAPISNYDWWIETTVKTAGRTTIVASRQNVPYRSINTVQCRWRILRILRAVETARRNGMEVENAARSIA
jgi:hypothetical protein